MDPPYGVKLAGEGAVGSERGKIGLLRRGQLPQRPRCPGTDLHVSGGGDAPHPLRKHNSSDSEACGRRSSRCAGPEKVRDAKAQGLRSEYDQLRQKPGESIDDLAMHMT